MYFSVFYLKIFNNNADNYTSVKLISVYLGLSRAPLETEEQVFLLQHELQMEFKMFLKYFIYLCAR